MFQLIERIQMIGSPLVLIMEMTPPGPPFRKWFPGLARADGAGERGSCARSYDRTDLPNVRFFPTNTVLAPLMAAGEVVPDGGHYTPEAHRVIGAALAEEILAWARAGGPGRTPRTSRPCGRELRALPE